MACSLLDSVSPSLCPRFDPFHCRGLVGITLGNVKILGAHTVVVLRIGNGGFQQLFDQSGSISGIVGQDTERALYILPSDTV